MRVFGRLMKIVSRTSARFRACICVHRSHAAYGVNFLLWYMCRLHIKYVYILRAFTALG